MSEAKVLKRSLPFDYSFGPKGNVFITSNCRKMTQESDRRVFVVIDAKKQQIGLGVPTEVYVGVQFKEMETRAYRAANVLKRDEGIAKGFQKEIVKNFPQIPSKALRNVLMIALEKRKGKVGRTGKLDVQRKANFAVWAHVRHCETDYDALLRSGVPREEARQQVEAKIREVCKAWDGGSQTKDGKPHKTPKSRERGDTAASRATKRAIQGAHGQPKRNAKPFTSTTTSANSAKPTMANKTGQFMDEQNAVVRWARRAYRAHRQKQSLEDLTKEVESPEIQHKASPKTSSPEVIATAVSFREKRTPKPRTLEPIGPSPPRKVQKV